MLVPRSSVFLGMLTEEALLKSSKRIFKTSHNYSLLKGMETFRIYRLQPFSYWGLVAIAATYLHSFCFQEATLRGKRKQ